MENFVLNNLLAWRQGQTPQPEIKASTQVRLSDTTALSTFLADYAAPYGVVLYPGQRLEKITANIWAVPLSLALGEVAIKA